MSIVSFGPAARAQNAVAFYNGSGSNLSPGFLHGGTFNVNSYKYFSFDYLDNALEDINFRNNNLYSVNSDGKTPYLNDISDLARLLVAGQLVAYSATQVASSGVFILGSGLASSVYGDGSVAYS